jgi:hypothetical protein
VDSYAGTEYIFNLMAGELLTQVDILEKRVERLERLLSKLDPQELIRLRSQIMDLYARIKR